MRFIFSLFLSLSQLSVVQAQHALRTWYKSPASYWEACEPLGNGRLGAMPNGAVFKENIVLNDITLWSGSAQDADKPDAYKYLPEIQKLLQQGKNIEAQQIMSKHFVCQGKGSGQGNGANVPYGCFQVLGNLGITYQYDKDSASSQVQNYHRQLSLDSAIASTDFTINNVSYHREYIASFDDDVIAIKLSSSVMKKLSFSISLDRPEKFSTVVANGQLIMKGQLDNGVDGKGMKYIVRAVIKPDGGQLSNIGTSLELKSANSAVIYISAGTDYNNPSFLTTSNTILRSAVKKSYIAERVNHIKKFQSLFQRVSLQLGNNDKDSLPTDERLQSFATNKNDNALAALYFQFGRYLLICSTRPGLLPPNLQGLWANTIQTPWNGDYHLNINIQMNHWPLDVTNLSPLNQPFYSLVKGLVAPGEKTAKAYYNVKGWVAHTISNVWGYTSPGEDYSWGSFNTGSAWLCQMLWTHYEFTKDLNYLRQVYPVLKGSAEFYLNSLVVDPKYGWLVTSPSNSPENAFILPDGREAHVCEAPTIDNQILRFLFAATISACDQLNKDNDFKLKLAAAIKLLPPNRIGSDGRLMEWLEEYKEADPHHRHTSHLWGLYPGNEITMETPQLADAARASLNARGDGGTGWSLAWKINFWARLHDGNRSLKLLQRLLQPTTETGFNMNSGGTYPNLFCGHTPFQIDGNFGGTAGIAEMLLQSHAGYIELLPALPGDWKEGSFSGLCIRGGANISAKWSDSKISEVTIKATADNLFKIKMPEGAAKAEIWKNGKRLSERQDAFITVLMKKSESVNILFPR